MNIRRPNGACHPRRASLAFAALGALVLAGCAETSTMRSAVVAIMDWCRKVNGLYKAEVIHRRSWPNREAVEIAALEWVDWFNHRRLLGPIGNRPPAEAEALYYAKLDGSDVAA